VLLIVGDAVEWRAIATAGQRGKEILVASGLSGGDKVITNAPASIADGARVREIKE